MKEILFVCAGNTCRSPMAEYLLKSELKKNGITGYSVSSAGLSAFPNLSASQNAVSALAEIDITEIKNHMSRYLTPDLLKKSDYIICMTEYIKNSLQINHPEFYNKLFTLKNIDNLNKEGDSNINDPFAGTLEDYKDCRDEIWECIKKIIEMIKRGIF